MESQRSILIIGLLLVSFLLWIEYQDAYGPKAIEPVPQAQQTDTPQYQGIPSAVDSLNNSAVPELPVNDVNTSSDVPQVNQSVVPQAVSTAVDLGNIITVKTDTLDIQIDLIGGDVIKADLIKYPVTQGANDSYPLLKPKSTVLHIAQSGLIGRDGTDNAEGRAKYQTTQTNFELTGDTLVVPLVWQSEAGVKVTKNFVFTRDSHLINVDFVVQNNKAEPAQVSQFAQLKQTLNDIGGGSMFMPIYRGTTYYTREDKYTKLSFGDIEDENLRVATVGGWAAMIEHYFVAAWVPPQQQTNTITARILQNQFAIIGYTGETVVIPAGETTTLSSQLYVGPKDQDKLKAIAEGLDFTVDYGFLWMISQPLFSLLQFLHSLVGNWGVAIILITLIVKGSMYWLTKKQYESMAKMRNLTPKMNQLKERYGDDRQKMSQAMMELYKKEKVNPMGGCFPLLLQMPIFLALYWVLLESVELRHADFALWITDLSVKDPYYVLPILTGASMYLLQKLQPMTIQDPLQQKLMQFMPVMMCVFFLWFPSGLVLYWLISNVVTLIQAKFIYASMEKRGIKSKS